MKIQVLTCYFSAIILLNGCSVFGDEESTNPIMVLQSNWSDEIASTFRNGTYDDKYNAYVADGKEKKANEERRLQVNRIIEGIDSYYDRKIKGSLITGKAMWDTGSEITTLLLTGAASVSGGDTPKVLAAIATAIQGTKISIDKNFFQDNSAIMLAIKMDQLRAEVYSEIQLSLEQSYTQYPLEQAMRDVIRYYSAGTMKGALIAIVKDAGAKQEKAENETKQLIKEKAMIAIDKQRVELAKDKKALE